MQMQATEDRIVLHEPGRGKLLGGVFGLLAGLAIAIVPWLSGMDQAWIAALIGGVFAVAGVFSLLSASSRTAVIEKDGQAGVTRRRLIGGAENTDAVASSDVVGVRLATGRERNRSGSDSDTSSVVSRLALVLADNSTLEIAVQKRGGTRVGGFDLGSLRRAPLADEAQAVADLLAIELEAVDTSSLKAVFGQIRSVVQEHTQDYQEE